MTHIYVSAVIPAPVAKVWSIIRDFNGLPNWHPSIAKSHIEDGLSGAEVGCIRNFELHDGGVIREKLLTLSDELHSCTYAIIESPMGVENYTATLRLTSKSCNCHADIQIARILAFYYLILKFSNQEHQSHSGPSPEVEQELETCAFGAHSRVGP